MKNSAAWLCTVVLCFVLASVSVAWTGSVAGDEVVAPATLDTARSTADRLAAAVTQIRESIGTWTTATEFLNEDGSVARKVMGEYVFEWVIPDRVASGRSTIPELDQVSAILFYVNEKKMTIEMVSVGADGMLWTMTGPAGEEVRTTQEFQARDGSTAQLRFTRYNVTPNRFESKMEYTNDGGKTWTPGNHQVFARGTIGQSSN